MRTEITSQSVDRLLYKKSLIHFIEGAWHVIEPGSAFTPGWHIDAIAEHLTAVSKGQIRNLLINMPPRHGKSSIVSVFWPAWVWISEPHKRWLFASYAASLSTRDSVKCRRLIMSPWYQSLFSKSFKLVDDQNEKTKFENDKSGYRLATSVCGVTTGEGGDYVCLDDPQNVIEAESEAVTRSTIEWWDEAMSTRGNDPKTVAKVIVMQRINAKDLSAHVLSQGGYDHLCLPAEYDNNKRITSIGWQDPRKEEGELLWPERFDKPALNSLKKSMGSFAVAGQLQQAPSVRSGGIIKRAWIKFYRELPKLETVIQSWDCTFKDTKSSDYVVGTVWGKKGSDRFLMYQIRDRMNFPTTIQSIKQLSALFPQAHAKVIEDKANGSAVIDMLKKEVIGLIPYNPDRSKEARAAAVSPQFEAGNVYFPDPLIAPWILDFIEELVNFPGAPHDDRVDSTSMALLRLAGQTSGDFPDAMTEDFPTIAHDIIGDRPVW